MALKLGTATPSKLYVGSTEVTKAYLGASEVYSSGPAIDPDAAAYITAVETADGQALEAGVVTAINDFVVGCKADGIWTAIKASCILAGARTLSGALVPLAGTAPTNFNFVAGDYNRKTGLVGDGVTKYLNTNRADDVDGQNDKHFSVYVPNGINANKSMLGGLATSPNRFTSLLGQSSEINFAINAPGGVGVPPLNATGFMGASRSTSSDISVSSNGVVGSYSQNSVPSSSLDIYVLARNLNGTANLFETNPLAFYSIGAALDLALLDARVSTLITALQFGINTGLAASDYDADTVAYVNRGYAAGGSLA